MGGGCVESDRVVIRLHYVHSNRFLSGSCQVSAAVTVIDH